MSLHVRIELAIKNRVRQKKLKLSSPSSALFGVLIETRSNAFYQDIFAKAKIKKRGSLGGSGLIF